MQNPSNATTTRFQLNSIPEKNSKNVKKVFLSLSPSAHCCCMSTKKKICVATGKLYHHSDFPPLPHVFRFLLCYLFTSVCLLCVRQRLSSRYFSNIRANFSPPMRTPSIMKWYHEHCVKSNMLHGEHRQIKIAQVKVKYIK